jgi:hypothetical protein
MQDLLIFGERPFFHNVAVDTVQIIHWQRMVVEMSQKLFNPNPRLASAL